MQHQRLKTTAGTLTVPVLDTEATSKLSITWHWSASSYTVTKYLKTRYHFVIDKHGKARHGVPVERNLNNKNQRRQAGYAAHVLNANSNNIGISAAAMGDAHENRARRGDYGSWPLTKAQIAGLVEVAAQLCYCYRIPVLPARVLGHEEWDSILGRPQDRWDVNCIPHLDIRPHLNADGSYDSTNYLRQQVQRRVAELAVPDDPELRDKQLRAFGSFVTFHDQAYASRFPVETIRTIKQLRQQAPLAGFSRDDLESA